MKKAEIRTNSTAKPIVKEKPKFRNTVKRTGDSGKAKQTNSNTSGNGMKCTCIYSMLDKKKVGGKL